MFDWWYKFLYSIVQTLMQWIEGMLKLFQIFAGIAPADLQQEIGADVQSNTLLELMFKNETVQSAFFIFMLIFVVIFIVSIIIGIVRSELNDNNDNKTPKIKLFRKSFTAFAIVILMPVLFSLAITFSAVLMTAVADTMGGGVNSLTDLPQKIFEICLPIDNIYFIKWSDPFAFVFSFADIPMDEFDYFIGAFVGIVLLVILAICCINLVMRLINVIALYLISPFVLAAMPLDDGARLNLWKDYLIAQLLGIGGTIICMYLYILLMPIVKGVFENAGFLGDIGYIIFAIGGAIAASKGGTLISHVVSHNTGMADGQQQQAATQMLFGASGMALRGVMALGGLSIAALRHKGGEGAAINSINETLQQMGNKSENQMFSNGNTGQQSMGQMLLGSTKAMSGGDREQRFLSSQNTQNNLSPLLQQPMLQNGNSGNNVIAMGQLPQAPLALPPGLSSQGMSRNSPNDINQTINELPMPLNVSPEKNKEPLEQLKQPNIGTLGNMLENNDSPKKDEGSK